MEHQEDTCHTVQDVREAALEVLKKRLASRIIPKPTHVLPPIAICIGEFIPPSTIEWKIPEPEPILHVQLQEEIRIIDIQRAVALKWEVRTLDILSGRRTADIVEPRQICCVLCKLLTRRSLPDIGRRTGGRDHTTILHAIRKYQWLFDRLARELKSTDNLSVWVNRAHELVTEGAE